MTKPTSFPYRNTYNYMHRKSDKKHNTHHVHFTVSSQIHYTSHFTIAKETHNLQQLPIYHKHPHRSLHCHYSRHKSKHARQTYKYCHHLANGTARDNKKILRTHPPQVDSTEENLPRHTRCTLAQLRTNKSLFLLSYLHKIDASTL